MKKLLYSLLAVSIIFTACDKHDEDSNNNINSISGVVGTWKYMGNYDASGNMEPFNNIDVENCQLSSTLILQDDGNAINQWYFLQDETSGPCTSMSAVYVFNYINSTTLQFETPTACGITNTATIINNGTQFTAPVCNGDDGTWEGDYVLYEKQ